MNIERELRIALLGMDAVTDIVSTRIWDEWFRSASVPAIVYEIDSEDEQLRLDGRGNLILASVNVICRADTRAASRDLSEAVRLNATDPGTGLAGYTHEPHGEIPVTERDEDSVTLRDGTTTVTLRPTMTSLVKIWLEGRQPAAVPKNDKGNSYWYDTNMSFRMQFAEVA